MNDQFRFRDPAEAQGFTMLPNVVLRSAQLDATAKIAYALLRDYARQERCAFPGMLTLAARVPTTKRSLQYYLQKLTAMGLVTVERRGQGKTNRYWIEPLSAATRARLSPTPPAGGAGDDLEGFFDDDPAGPHALPPSPNIAGCFRGERGPAPAGSPGGAEGG